MVPSTGIEPVYPASEASALSIKLRGLTSLWYLLRMVDATYGKSAWYVRRFRLDDIFFPPKI